MRLTPFFVALACLTPVVTVILAWPAPTADLLDERKVDYLEDEYTGRRLADLRLRLIGDNHTPRCCTWTYQPPARRWILRLTRHPHAEVRRTAMLEFTKFPGEKVPHAELLAIGHDENADDEDRRVGILAASYSDHPAVYVELHRLLGAPDDPCFRVAIDRVAALGDGHTEQVLAALPRDGLADDQTSRLAKTETTLYQRLHAPRSTLPVPNATRLLHRAAWAVHDKDAQPEALVAWTRKQLRRAAKTPRLRAQLQKLAKNPGGSGIPSPLREWVQTTAKHLLADQSR